jgi:hypothetical protein
MVPGLEDRLMDCEDNAEVMRVSELVRALNSLLLIL